MRTGKKFVNWWGKGLLFKKNFVINKMSLKSSLLGAALGFGFGGNGQSAALGAAAGYAINKFSNHKPLFGGACEVGKAHSPATGHCITVGGATHKNLKQGYSQRQMDAIRNALHEGEKMGHHKHSHEMKVMVGRAIRESA
jgi:hypothetical protein